MNLVLDYYLTDSMREIKSDEALKEKVSIHLESKSEHTVTTPSCSSSPAQSPARQSQNYRTLQNYANNINRPNVLNMSSVRKDIDYASMKRWHTAPKDKHKVSALYMNALFRFYTSFFKHFFFRISFIQKILKI